MRYENFVDLLSEISPGVEATYKGVLGEWFPEEPPVTALFSALGDRIVESFDGVGTDVNGQIFGLIERAMESDDPRLVTAVATGLLESLVNLAVQDEGLWDRMILLLGPRSMRHAKAWLGE